jgi:hypothetical protein
VQKFSDNKLSPNFVQTKIVNIDESTDKVALGLSNRLVSVVVDQSGSQSWNDNTGLRHVLTKKMIDKVGSYLSR